MFTNFISALRKSFINRSSYDKYNLFNNEQINISLKYSGYCVTDFFLDENTLLELQKVYDQFLSIHNEPIGEYFYTTGNILDKPSGKYALTTVRDVFIPQLERLTNKNAATVLPSVFQIKPSSNKSELIPHLDSSILNEEEFHGICAWVSLIDSDVQSGALYVLPGSHKYSKGYRSSMATNTLLGKGKIIQEYSHTLKSKAGQVILFDNALIHGSHANNSGRLRLAVSGGIFPKTATLNATVITESTPPGTVDLYEVNQNYLTDPLPTDNLVKLSLLGKYVGNFPINQLSLSMAQWKIVCRLNQFLLPKRFKG